MGKRKAKKAAKRKTPRTPSPAKRNTGVSRPAAPKQASRTAFTLKDAVVETALQIGEHAGLLEDYFGAEGLQELRELSREAASRAVRGGPMVLIVPGIMGSKIGKKSKITSLFDEVYWVDLIDIAAGNLAALRLGPRSKPFEALGVILLAYLKLKLRLKIAGFEVEFYPFDWRQSIAKLGNELKSKLDEWGRNEVNLVCHSMGGLVARAAIAGGAKFRSLIMLGTPNYGSFLPVMALRGTHGLLRKLALIDVRHSAGYLASEVFNTFPGLTEMLPSPDRFDKLDLYDLNVWPKGNLRPRKEILSRVRGVQQSLAPADRRFYLIAGVNQKTVTGMLKKPAEGTGHAAKPEQFEYEFSRAGDGTVPLKFAELEGATTYYIEESHGSLANNRTVAAAVRDIIRDGKTKRLPQSWTGLPQRAVEKKSDEDLAVEPSLQCRGAALGQREIRHLLEEVVAPTAREPQESTVEPTDKPRGASRGYTHRFDQVVVGRRRQHRLDVRFAMGSITEVKARAIGLGIFRGVTPGGAASAIDRELGGAVTELTRRRMFSGNVGEIFMLPTGMHRIAVDFIAFVGLGAFDRFNDDALQIAAENLVRTFVDAGIEEFATVLMGAASGGTPTRSLQAMLSGFLRGMLDADEDHRFRRVIICETDPQNYQELKGELYRLSSTPLCEGVEVTLDETRLPEPRPSVESVRRSLRRTDTTYLIVRQERHDEKSKTAEFRSSVLTADAKATVVTGLQTVDDKKLEALLDRLADHSANDISQIGTDLAELVLAKPVREVLPSQKNRHLVVVHDAPSSRLPWETLGLGNAKVWHPAADRGLSRLYAAENLSIAKWLEGRIHDSVFRVLLIVNPTGDLEGAVAEGRALRDIINSVPNAQLDILKEEEATRAAVLEQFRSGVYDVVHYAGHAFFDKHNPERSGIVCHDMPLGGADLPDLLRLPTLVFFNACESARVRSYRKQNATKRRKDFRDELKKGVGLAEAFMRGGVANFVGTYWPVGDAEAETFAKNFYGKLLHGESINVALQHGRRGIQGSADWANYIHYGHPDFAIKELGGTGGGTA